MSLNYKEPNRKWLNLIPIVWTCFVLLSCNELDTPQQSLLRPIPVSESGINFVNQLTENDSVNYFNYGYMYLGGGVAVGDLNNDGLSDIYFTANMSENKLFINKGDLQFEDITHAAGVASDDRWVTGVTMADVNADGWLDIYISVSGIWTTRANQLFLNKGLNDEGIPVFEESAEQFGIADKGNSMQGSFIDFDNDGDLDLHVSNYPPTTLNASLREFESRMARLTELESNSLYENVGGGTFIDVTEQAGLRSFGLTMSTAFADYNNDGWLDLYESNDFATPDKLYMNNGDGTFTNKLEDAVNQTSFYGMGTDAADFNNDGWLDLLQLDMAPADNRRSKANMLSMQVPVFDQMTKSHFGYQYMRNALQMSNGVDREGVVKFSNVAHITGLALTDWSWACLFVDLDNDGWKDVLVTNGNRRETTNHDYFDRIYRENAYVKTEEIDYLKLVAEMPSERIKNFLYKNNGGFDFSQQNEEWGFGFNGFSHGVAYGDLDNDGDLDLVVNNLDDESLIYENTTNNSSGNNYLRVVLEGTKANPSGIGAKVTLVQGDMQQIQEMIPTRGYQSAIEPILHFGLGQVEKIDKILIEWPGVKSQILEGVMANQTITVKLKDAIDTESTKGKVVSTFQDITKQVEVDHRHQENVFDDYFYQVLLPHKMSRFGPALAVADVNGDGLEDFYVGGASGFAGMMYFQTENGTFKASKEHNNWSKEDTLCEDVNAAFADVNGDGALDLYVVSGGADFPQGDSHYQDRIYINNGRGEFVKHENALPKVNSNGSKVAFGDYDQDGDLDVLVGARSIPRRYPLADKSYLLRNDSKGDLVKFTDVTAEIVPDLMDVGVVTDALWVDINNDQQLDMVLTGEWMPVTILINENGQYKDATKAFGLSESTGWWYSVTAEDFDNDGDIDLIGGNLGLNYKYQASKDESFDIYVSDYDKNDKLDIVLGYYDDGKQYPVRGRECSSQQIPNIKYKYKNYESFAVAELEDIYSSKGLEESIHYQAFNFATSYVENIENTRFMVKTLPDETQISSVNSIVKEDVNGDGHMDLVFSGNLYSSEAETPRNDASYGMYLTGDGAGNFSPVKPLISGLFVSGDVKNASSIRLAQGQKAIIFAKNDGHLQIVKY